MNEEVYTKKELELMHKSLHDRIEGVCDDVKKGFDGVFKRQDATNGRVRWLEKMMWMAVGGLSTLSIILTVLTIVGNIYGL